MNELEQLQQEYGSLLATLQWAAEAPDYDVLNRHTAMLDHLSRVGNSGITVFDAYQQRHVYTSPNYAGLFGYDMNLVKEHDSSYFDSRIHPDDHLSLIRNGITTWLFYYSLPVDTRTDYKLINEYRIRNSADKYIRVIEQHQALELDANGNVWLSLSVMDIAPNQDHTDGLQSQIVNFRNGEITTLSELRDKQDRQVLSVRELGVLNLLKDGLLSKEIAAILSISVHTVNTHRQRILAKLNASNTVEAIRYAKGLGLV